MDKKVQAALLFILAVFIFMAGTRYGNLILDYSQPEVQEIAVESPEEQTFEKKETKEDSFSQDEEKEIYVHITGAVKQPGLYKLDSAARVNDAIKLAVPLPKADVNALNLAEKIQDQQKIYVPLQGEVTAQQGNVSNNLINNSAKTKENIQGVVNINTASIQDLDTLPGIGPSYAERIIQYRTDNGPFEKIEDIQDVPGIGPKKYEDIKERITVN